MAFRIENNREPVLRAKRAKSEPYLQWIRQLPCIVSGRHPVDAAHLSTHNSRYGHAGRARSSKSSDRWALPLSRDLHRQSHCMNEMEFWSQFNFGYERPYVAALVLWGIYSDGGPDALQRAENWIRREM